MVDYIAVHTLPLKITNSLIIHDNQFFWRSRRDNRNFFWNWKDIHNKLLLMFKRKNLIWLGVTEVYSWPEKLPGTSKTEGRKQKSWVGKAEEAKSWWEVKVSLNIKHQVLYIVSYMLCCIIWSDWLTHKFYQILWQPCFFIFNTEKHSESERLAFLLTLQFYFVTRSCLSHNLFFYLLSCSNVRSMNNNWVQSLATPTKALEQGLNL